MPPAPRSSRGFGEEHIRTGKPICYTSANSVFQIAAHETHFGLERLYDLCRTVRRLVDPLNIGRVIARPFAGETPETFERTANRRDFAVPPPEPTLLDRLVEARQQGDRHRQDRRYLRASGRLGGAQGGRQHGAVRRGARRDGRCRGRRSRVRQFRRFRHALRPPPRHSRLCRGAGGVRPPAARKRWPRCGKATFCCSPPTMAAIRHGAAPTTRASACPSSEPGLA